MIFFPFADENPSARTPILTWLLIGLNILVFLYQMSLGPANQLLVNDLGVRPSVFSEFSNLHTLFTSAFLHGGFMHLFSNMVVLYIYGDNVESHLGRKNFLIFYFLGGISAAYFQSLFSGGVDVPMIGASGCIAAIMGAYFVLYPTARVKVFVWFLIFVQIMRVPANIVIGFWILGQLISAAGNTYDGVAYFAHIGGFIFGFIAIKYFFKAYVDKPRVYGNFEEVDESDLPIFRKNKSQGLSKKDD